MQLPEGSLPNKQTQWANYQAKQKGRAMSEVQLTEEQAAFAKRRALIAGYLAKPLEEMLMDAYLQGMADATWCLTTPKEQP